MKRSSMVNAFSSLIVVSASVMLTGILGFFNQLVLARLFGTTIEMDVYLAAVAVPGVLTGIGLSVFTFVIVPTLARYEQYGEEIRKLTTTFLFLTFCLSLLISTTGITLSPKLMDYLASNLLPDALTKAIEINRFAWLIAGFSLLNSFFISIHYTSRQFFIPSAVSILTPLAMLFSALTLSQWIGIKSVAIGWLAASILQTIFLLPGVIHQFIHIKFIALGHPEVATTLRRMVPAAIALLPFTTPQMIEVFWASKLEPGSISYLGYSEKLVVVLSTAIGYSVATVSFPSLARDVAKGKKERAYATVAHHLRLILLVSVLLSALIIPLRIPLLEILFERGAFDESATQGVASVLPWYLLGMIAIAAVNLIYRLYYAIDDFKIPAKIGIIMPLLYFGLAGIMSRYFSYIGIGIAFASSWWVVFIMSTLLARKAGGSLWNRELVYFLGKVGIVAAVSGITCGMLLPLAYGALGFIGGTVAIAGVGIVFMAFTCRVLRIGEIAAFVRYFKCWLSTSKVEF